MSTLETEARRTMTEYLGCYKRPKLMDGRQTVWLCFDPETGALLEVHPHGYHRSAPLNMIFQDASEARWYIENHPEGKRYYR